jgi:hypothetical protein
MRRLQFLDRRGRTEREGGGEALRSSKPVDADSGYAHRTAFSIAEEAACAFAQLLGKVLPLQVALTTLGKSVHEYTDAELTVIIASEQERRAAEEEGV